jgi:hypothetical protein
VTCLVGQTVSVAVTASGDPGRDAPGVTFAASDESVRVSPSGAALALTCVTPGTAAVTATSGLQSVTDSVPVTVTPLVPLDVSLEPARLACVLGESAPVHVRVAGSRTGRPTLSASSADANVRVSTGGASAVVQCASPGSARVTVTAVDGRQRGDATLPVAVTLRPQTVVLFATPKFIPDFSNPGPAVDEFLAHYEPLASRAAETIVSSTTCTPSPLTAASTSTT